MDSQPTCNTTMCLKYTVAKDIYVCLFIACCNLMPKGSLFFCLSRNRRIVKVTFCLSLARSGQGCDQRTAVKSGTLFKGNTCATFINDRPQTYIITLFCLPYIHLFDVTLPVCFHCCNFFSRRNSH